MGIQISQIDEQIRAGLPEAHAGWKEQTREYAYYCGLGTSLVKARSGELGPDYEARAKLSVKVLPKVVNKLGAGLYGRGGPARKICSHSGPRTADDLYQGVITEHKLDKYLHRADQLAWLHGYSALQVLPNLDQYQYGGCPVIIRCWRADETYVWLGDDGVHPEAVLIRSTFQRTRQLRYQVWTGQEIATYYSRPGDLDLTGSGTHRFDPEDSESGANPLGVIPFCWFHNDFPTATFFTPGIGKPLAETSYACDSLLSDLQQALTVFCIPTQYSQNLSVNARQVDRPGNLVNLVPTDDAKSVEVFFRQPNLATSEVWQHVQNAVNSDLSGLGLPMQVELDGASTQPESGVALAIRWIAPTVDLFRVRQELFKHSETGLARMIAHVGGVATGNQQLLELAPTLELELDFPEPHLPVPSPERDMQDQFEIEQGWTSVIQVVMQRFGKSRSQAIEHLKQVKIDQQELAALGAGSDTAPAAQRPELRAGTGDDREDERLEDQLATGGPITDQGPQLATDSIYQGNRAPTG